MNSLLIRVVTLATLCNCLQFPPSFKKCDKRRSDFNQCLSDAIYTNLRLLDEPQKSFDLPSLYDVEFPPDVVTEIGNRTYGLLQKYSKFRFIGLSRPASVTASLDFDPLVSTLRIAATYPQETVHMEYEAQGTIVLLPLNVATSVDFILNNPTFVFTFKLEEYDKGAKYFRVIESEFDAQPDEFQIYFKQLFTNKRLNEEFNSALCEKGVQSYQVHKHLRVVFAPHFGSIVNSFLEKVPAAQLFVK
ncbi:hypothetical protein Zmor_018819 [Zophobas morio]|uniref:Uncharacterized protein n=1 Tax=Zophobas morio TaxID=2755281 RepID=A0AA38ICZ7_9CUCU|nr:hypothetical protein Zmor_018819 [Zophobas morio]